MFNGLSTAKDLITHKNEKKIGFHVKNNDGKELIFLIIIIVMKLNIVGHPYTILLPKYHFNSNNCCCSNLYYR